MRALAGTITYFGAAGESGREWFDDLYHYGARTSVSRHDRSAWSSRRTDRLGAAARLSRLASAGDGYTNSKSANGESGLLAYPSAIEVAYLGDETIRVEAGEFAGRHYQLRCQPQWPVANLWVNGDDALFLRLTWELNQSRYELTQLRKIP